MSRTKQVKQNQSVLTFLFNICITFSITFYNPNVQIGKSTSEILIHFFVQNQERDKQIETFSIENPLQSFNLQYIEILSTKLDLGAAKGTS